MPIIILSTIQQDMLKKVREQRPSYNNASAIASSVTISSIKLLYYQLFASVYSWVGQHAQVVMVNSSWTKHHVEQLWWYGSTTNDNHKHTSSDNASNRRTLSLVYPPCNTTELLSMPLASTVSDKATPMNPNHKRIILSIAQFRPEKDHMLQIRAMKCLVDMAKE